MSILLSLSIFLGFIVAMGLIHCGFSVCCVSNSFHMDGFETWFTLYIYIVYVIQYILCFVPMLLL